MSETVRDICETITVDNNPNLNPDICIDILELESLPRINIIWASPPCRTFSIASISRHWIKEGEKRTPRTKDSENGLRMVSKTIGIIRESNPKIWFIENPRGMLRKVIPEIFERFGITDYVRHTITYCQYGERRMKPTDIWTNCKTWKPRKMCKNGDSCHEKAPRGSPTGTQGLKGGYLRGILPFELCKEIRSEIIKNFNLEGRLNE